MTDPLHTEPVEVTQLRVASDRCYPGLHYIEGAPFRISFWTIATNIDPVEGVRRLRFADELVAAWNTRTAAEAESRAREARLREALEKARKIIRDVEDYMARPNRGDWESECALCMGELFDDDREAIAAIDAALTASEAPDA